MKIWVVSQIKFFQPYLPYTEKQQALAQARISEKQEYKEVAKAQARFKCEIRCSDEGMVDSESLIINKSFF
jgi:hypothetical protein